MNVFTRLYYSLVLTAWSRTPDWVKQVWAQVEGVAIVDISKAVADPDNEDTITLLPDPDPSTGSYVGVRVDATSQGMGGPITVRSDNGQEVAGWWKPLESSPDRYQFVFLR